VKAFELTTSEERRLEGIIAAAQAEVMQAEVIEEAIAVIDTFEGAEGIIQAIRALKEKP
jgi:streptogramin lyase